MPSLARSKPIPLPLGNLYVQLLRCSVQQRHPLFDFDTASFCKVCTHHARVKVCITCWIHQCVHAGNQSNGFMGHTACSNAAVAHAHNCARQLQHGSLEQIVNSTEMTNISNTDLKQDGRSSMAADVATMWMSSASLLGAMTTMLGRQAM